MRSRGGRGIGAEPVALAFHLGAERLELAEIDGELVGGLAEVGTTAPSRIALRTEEGVLGRTRMAGGGRWPIRWSAASTSIKLRDVRAARRGAPLAGAPRRARSGVWVSSSWTRLLVSISVRLSVSRSWSSASISARSSEALLVRAMSPRPRRVGLPRDALGALASWHGRTVAAGAPRPGAPSMLA